MKDIITEGIVTGTSEQMRTKWKKVYRQASINTFGIPVGIFSKEIYVPNQENELKIGDRVQIVVTKLSKEDKPL